MKNKKLIFILPIIAVIVLVGIFTVKKLVSNPNSKAEITANRSVSVQEQKDESNTQSPTHEATLTETSSSEIISATGRLPSSGNSRKITSRIALIAPL